MTRMKWWGHVIAVGAALLVARLYGADNQPPVIHKYIKEIRIVPATGQIHYTVVQGEHKPGKPIRGRKTKYVIDLDKRVMSSPGKASYSFGVSEAQVVLAEIFNFWQYLVLSEEWYQLGGPMELLNKPGAEQEKNKVEQRRLDMEKLKQLKLDLVEGGV